MFKKPEFYICPHCQSENYYDDLVFESYNGSYICENCFVEEYPMPENLLCYGDISLMAIADSFNVNYKRAEEVIDEIVDRFQEG